MDRNMGMGEISKKLTSENIQNQFKILTDKFKNANKSQENENIEIHV